MTSYIRYLLAGLCLIGLACPHLLAQSCPSASITSARAQSGSNFSLVKVASELKNPDSDLVLVTAHRGYWEYCPENTIEAFQAAIDTGIEAVEMDVRLSAAGSDKAGKSFSNGEVFLTHDYDLRGEAPGTVGSQQNNLIYTLTPAQLQSRTMVDRRGNNATDDSGAALTFHTFTDLPMAATTSQPLELQSRRSPSEEAQSISLREPIKKSQNHPIECSTHRNRNGCVQGCDHLE